MNLYWFSDEEGGEWDVIAAHDEKQAWILLAASNYSDQKPYPERMGEEEAREYFELNAVTRIDKEAVGKVASISPREVNFFIRDKPGGELSSLRNY